MRAALPLLCFAAASWAASPARAADRVARPVAHLVSVEGTAVVAPDGPALDAPWTAGLSYSARLDARWRLGGQLALSLPDDPGSELGSNGEYEYSYLGAWPVRPELFAELAPLAARAPGLHLRAGVSARGVAFHRSRGWVDWGEDTHFAPVPGLLAEGRLGVGYRHLTRRGLALGVDAFGGARGVAFFDEGGRHPRALQAGALASIGAGWNPGEERPARRGYADWPVGWKAALWGSVGAVALGGAAAWVLRPCGPLDQCHWD